jgi:hypothetical protein
MPVSRRVSPAACFVVASIVAVVAIGGLALGSRRAGRSPPAVPPGAASSTAGVGGGRPPAVGREGAVGATGLARQETPGGVRQAHTEAGEATTRAGQVTAGARPATTRAGPVQENPEQVDPALRREHDRLLAQRPAFQHLPYRDHVIGVGLDRVLPSGRLELLVTYLGSRARAVDDLRRWLARCRDPGTAYVERYQRVF